MLIFGLSMWCGMFGLWFAYLERDVVMPVVMIAVHKGSVLLAVWNQKYQNWHLAYSTYESGRHTLHAVESRRFDMEFSDDHGASEDWADLLHQLVVDNMSVRSN